MRHYNPLELLAKEMPDIEKELKDINGTTYIYNPNTD